MLASDRPVPAMLRTLPKTERKRAVCQAVTVSGEGAACSVAGSCVDGGGGGAMPSEWNVTVGGVDDDDDGGDADGDDAGGESAWDPKWMVDGAEGAGGVEGEDGAGGGDGDGGGAGGCWAAASSANNTVIIAASARILIPDREGERRGRRIRPRLEIVCQHAHAPHLERNGFSFP